MSQSVDVLRSAAELTAVIPEWERFLSLRPAGRNMRNDPRRIALMLSLHPALVPRIVVVRGNGGIVAIAPFHVEPTAFTLKWRGRGLKAMPLRSMQIFGDEILIGSNGDAAMTCDRIFRTAAAESRTFDFITIHSLQRDSPLWQYASAEAGRRLGWRFAMTSPIERVHVLDLPETHEEYLAALGAKTRQNLRRTTRRMFESGEVRVIAVTTPEQVPTFLQHVDYVFQRSWQARELGRRKRDTPTEIAYYEGLARYGWLRAYVLAIDARPVAFELGFQYDGTYYGHECAYDEAAADRGPGSILLHLVLEDLFRGHRPLRVHFGFGHAAYKQSFGSTASHKAAHVALIPRNRWRILLAAQRLLDRWSRVELRRSS